MGEIGILKIIAPPPPHFPGFCKMISNKGILHVQSCQCVSSQTSNSRGHGPKGGGGYLCPPANLVPILEQRIDERTLSMKTWTLFAVLSEKLSIFTALLIWINLNNECVLRFFFIQYDLKTDPFLQKWYFSYPKRWQRCALHSSEKSILFVFVKHRYQIG